MAFDNIYIQTLSMMTPRKMKPSQTLLTHTGLATELETRITEDALSKCNLQKASPLFTILPPELRNTIFELATQPYDDPNYPYKETEYCYRPGHHAKQRTDTTLLSTCRLIWLETNHLPLQQATPTFWFKAEERRPQWTRKDLARWHRYSLRRPKREWVCEEVRFHRSMEKLTPKNGENLREMRFFGQLCWLESNQLGYLLAHQSVIPPRLVITVRHTDWWWWENDQPLEMDTLWLGNLLGNRGVRGAREVVLELETLEGKVGQLKGVVAGIKTDYGDVEGWRLDEGGSGEEVMSWTGVRDVGGREWRLYGGMRELRYKVFALAWTRQEGNDS